MSRRIRKSYEIVTDESASSGDAAERGWDDEIGVEIAPDDYDIDEYGDESSAVVALAVKHIGGGVEPSDYPQCSPGHTWYTTIDDDIDYSTGERTTYSYFLDGFSADEEMEIYARLTGRTVTR